eukprot:3340328-Rhodomonas_salina.1
MPPALADKSNPEKSVRFGTLRERLYTVSIEHGARGENFGESAAPFLLLVLFCSFFQPPLFPL